MKKTLYIALGFTVWSFIVLPVGSALVNAPWWLAFILGLFSGSATLMWWLVYAYERKRIQWRKDHGYTW